MGPKNRGEAKPASESQPPVAAQAGNPAALPAPVDLEEVRNLVANRANKAPVLINVPIWGWTGDGKTCALLTAIHYGDPVTHPLAFALVKNPDELNTLEGSAEEYRGMHLASGAAATTKRLSELSELFIDRNEWPPGTDSPSVYVLAVRNVDETLGYVLFPDIKGGSFKEQDETAREVIQKAHAAVLLVNPELYAQKTTEGKRYKDEILDRLQRFASAIVPVAVMITKADAHQGPHHATDSTHAELSVIVERLRPKAPLVICRVSVVGIEKEIIENKLPPSAERNPEEMVKGFAWVVAQALSRPAEQVRKLKLPLNFRALTERNPLAAAESIVELRLVGEYSNAPGPLLCASTDDARYPAFAFVSEDGELFESAVVPGAEDQEFKSVGSIPEWDPDRPISAFYAAGEFTVGALTKCNFVWQGAKGGPLEKLALPYEMSAWVSVSARVIIGVDSSGRLHALRLEGGKWRQVDYIEGFIAPSTLLVCSVVESRRQVFAYNGTTVEGVAVAPEGTLGGRVSPAVVCKFDSARALANRLGMCAAITKAGHLVTGGPTASLAVGATKPDAPVAHALAGRREVLAYVAPDLRLVVAAVQGGEIKRSESQYSPMLPENPESLAWADNGEILAATFDKGTWALYRPWGLED